MRFTAHFFLCGPLFFVAAGCQTFHPEPLSGMDAGTSFQARTLDDAELRAFLETGLSTNFAPWPLKTWDLPALTLVAFYYHPSLEASLETTGKRDYRAARLLRIEAQAKAKRALSDLEFAAQYPLAPSLQTMLTQTNPRNAKERNP